MTSGQKVASSLLISVLVSCVFTVVAFSGLFELLEVNFYQPVVQEIKQKKIDEIAVAQNEYFNILMQRFDAFCLSSDVKTYADTHPEDSAVKRREVLRSQLLTSTSALTGMRIVDDNGRNIYFSTFASDLISGKKGVSYRNYDSGNEIDYDSVRAKKSLGINSEPDKKCRIIKDGDNSRLIFSVPFYNSKDLFTGSALFYCDSANFSKFLFNRNLIDMNGFALLLTDSVKDKKLSGFGGFVFGLPNYGRTSLKSQILEKWKSGGDAFWKLIPTAQKEASTEQKNSEESSVCAFSFKNERDDFGFITLLYDESELKFPYYIRILL